MSRTTSTEREYVVLLYGDEEVWARADDEQRAAEYASHGRFSQECAARGHTIVGGAELTHSRAARTVRRGPQGSPVVTDGPYAELVEQLGGYYVVRTADVDDLARLAEIILGTGAIEIRETVPEDAPEPSDVDVAGATGATAGGAS